MALFNWTTGHFLQTMEEDEKKEKTGISAWLFYQSTRKTCSDRDPGSEMRMSGRFFADGTAKKEESGANGDLYWDDYFVGEYRIVPEEKVIVATYTHKSESGGWIVHEGPSNLLTPAKMERYPIELDPSGLVVVSIADTKLTEPVAGDLHGVKQDIVDLNKCFDELWTAEELLPESVRGMAQALGLDICELIGSLFQRTKEVVDVALARSPADAGRTDDSRRQHCNPRGDTLMYDPVSGHLIFTSKQLSVIKPHNGRRLKRDLYVQPGGIITSDSHIKCHSDYTENVGTYRIEAVEASAKGFLEYTFTETHHFQMSYDQPSRNGEGYRSKINNPETKKIPITLDRSRLILTSVDNEATPPLHMARGRLLVINLVRLRLVFEWLLRAQPYVEPIRFEVFYKERLNALAELVQVLEQLAARVSTHAAYKELRDSASMMAFTNSNLTQFVAEHLRQAPEGAASESTTVKK